MMARLWAPPPRNYRSRSVADWAGSLAELRPHYNGTASPFPAALVDRAEGLFAELLSSQAAPVVLHSDLHHLNILAAGPDEWRAIDPQGVIGEPAYELGAFLRNPLPSIAGWPNLPHVLERRIAIFAETLGLDKYHIHGWALAQAVPKLVHAAFKGRLAMLCPVDEEITVRAIASTAFGATGLII